MTPELIPHPQIDVHSPGRVNLLGEHVDYNQGIVLPAAIDRTIHMQARLLDEPIVRLHAIDLAQESEFSLAGLEKKIGTNGQPLPSWAEYPAGVAYVLQQKGLLVKGIEAAFSSTVPMGAGLSSSAAVEVGFASLWQAAGGWDLDRLVLAQYCQKAENEYVGMNCGLMDQFACACGVEGHVLLFDVRSLEYRPVPMPVNTAIVIADSTVRRSLTSSAYNERRRECETAVQILKKHLPAIESLRDVSPEDLYRYESDLPEVVRMRARHIVEEIARVAEAVRCLDAGDRAGFGRTMYATHASLRDLYQVSVPELDLLVELASGIPGCWGARLTGAGFGGCTVNLVEESQAEAFIQTLKSKYAHKTGKDANVYLCHAHQGVEVERIG